MRRFVLSLFILCHFHLFAQAQDWPRPTEAGEKALDTLIARCVEAGGLALTRDPKTGRDVLSIIDPAKLSRALARPAISEVAPLRDALVVRNHSAHPSDRVALSTLLDGLAEASGDGRTRGFSAVFRGLLLSRNEPGAAIDRFRQGADIFEKAGDRGWQATCLNQAGLICRQHGSFPVALEYHEKALAIRLDHLGGDHPDVASSYTDIAVCHAELGNPARALDLNRKALEIRLKSFGPLHPDIAGSYSNIAECHRAMGDPFRALDFAQKALAIRLELFGPRHTEVAGSYLGIGNSWLDLGDPAHALESYQKALAISLDLLGPRHLQVADIYHNIGNCNARLEGAARALESYEKALAIRLDALGPRHPAVAASYIGIANCCEELGEPARSLEENRKALTILLEAFGPNHHMVAMIYNNIANCHQDLSDPQRALEYSQKALAIRLETLGPKHPLVADSYNNLACFYQAFGETVRAMDFHQKALAIRLETAGPKHPLVADSYIGIASGHQATGEPARASELYGIALAIRLQAFGPNHPLVAQVYNNIAACLIDTGDPARALELFRIVQAIQLATLGQKHPDIAKCYNNISACHAYLGDPTRALDFSRQALEITLEALGPKHIEISRGYSNIANYSRALGDPARALEYDRKALAIRLEALGPKHPEVATSYLNIAYCHRQLGNLAEAVENCRLALESLTPLESAPRVDLADTPPFPASSLGISILRLRASVLARGDGDYPADAKGALADLKLAANMLDRLRDLASGTTRSQEVDLVLRGELDSELWSATIDLLARLAVQEHGPARLEAAIGAAERGASRAFLRSFGRAHAGLAGRVSPETLAAIAGIDSRLSVLDQKLDKVQSVPVEKRDPKAVGALLDERRVAEAERGKVIARVERDFPQYYAFKYPRPCTIDQARATLGEDEVALHFVAGSATSFLVVLEKAPRAYPTGIGIHRLPADGELSEQVAALMHEKVLMDPDATRERGTRLYQTLLGPAARAIEGRDLVIVAGGALGELPFEVLAEPDGKGGQPWLVQGHRVRYAPSLTALHFVGLWDAARPPTDRPLWALGDPTYSTDDPRMAKSSKPDESASITLAQASRATRGEALTRLAASGAEVERIAGLYPAGASDRLVGAEATEAAVKQLSRSGELARHRLVHFACHGVLGSADGLPPGLVLAQGGDQEGEDGYLRLDEVANLKLDADLVVLSACQTARGRRGRVEGVSSLGRAFLYAGCRGVVGSLWKVDDAATADLMTAFHARLKVGQPTGEALRVTQLEAIADGQPPYFWAPFILLGR